MMGTKYNNMMLQAKAYNLGVERPDFDILQSVCYRSSLYQWRYHVKMLLILRPQNNRIAGGVAQTSSQLKPRGGAARMYLIHSAQ